jgi:hypothetical protein
MKKIDTSKIQIGIGYPPSKKGLDFLQECYQDTLAELARGAVGASGVANTPYVLYGCVAIDLGGYDFQFTKGALLYNDEVYSFPAVASLEILDTSVCTITITNDLAADPTEMTDASLVSMHNHRDIVVSDSTSVTAGDLKFDFNDLIYIYSGFTQGTIGAGWTTPTEIFYKKDRSSVLFRGEVVYVSGGTIFTLPAGSRPSQILTFACPFYDDSAGAYSASVAVITISTNGNVSLVNSAAAGIAADDSIYFGDIVFTTTVF